MKIKKNDDGSYTLMCCSEEFFTLHNAVKTLIECGDAPQRRYPAPWLKRANLKLLAALEPFLCGAYNVVDKCKCEHCAALFDNSHPKCKANK